MPPAFDTITRTALDLPLAAREVLLRQIDDSIKAEKHRLLAEEWSRMKAVLLGSEEKLLAIERHLHAVIREHESAWEALHEYAIPLPSLITLLKASAEELWESNIRIVDNETGGDWFYPVPGLHGGFRLSWVAAEPEPKLQSRSFSRILDGYGESHEITASGPVYIGSEPF